MWGEARSASSQATVLVRSYALCDRICGGEPPLAGAKDGVFAEKISPYLRQKMAERGSSAELSFLDLQYVVDPSENVSRAHEVARHYESELHPTFEGEE